MTRVASRREFRWSKLGAGRDARGSLSKDRDTMFLVVLNFSRRFSREVRRDEKNSQASRRLLDFPGARPGAFLTHLRRIEAMTFFAIYLCQKKVVRFVEHKAARYYFAELLKIRGLRVYRTHRARQVPPTNVRRTEAYVREY